VHSDIGKAHKWNSIRMNSSKSYGFHAPSHVIPTDFDEKIQCIAHRAACGVWPLQQGGTYQGQVLQTRGKDFLIMWLLLQLLPWSPKKSEILFIVFSLSDHDHIILLIRPIHLIPDRGPYVEYSARYCNSDFC
jgi:hypothetical protein